MNEMLNDYSSLQLSVGNLGQGHEIALRDLVDTCAKLREYRKTISFFRRVHNMDQDTIPVGSFIPLLCVLGDFVADCGLYNTAILLYQEALLRSERLGCSHIICYLKLRMAVFDFLSGNDEDSETLFRDALKLLESIDRPEELVIIYSEVALYYLFRDLRDRSLKFFRKAQKHSKGLSESYWELFTSIYLGAIYLSVGRVEMARSYLFNAERLSSSYPSLTLLSMLFHSLGQSYMRTRDYDKAVAYLRRAVDIIENTLAMISSDDVRLTFFARKLEPYLDILLSLYHSGDADSLLQMMELTRARQLAPVPELASSTSGSQASAVCTPIRTYRLFSDYSVAQDDYVNPSALVLGFPNSGFRGSQVYINADQSSAHCHIVDRISVEQVSGALRQYCDESPTAIVSLAVLGTGTIALIVSSKGIQDVDLIDTFTTEDLDHLNSLTSEPFQGQEFSFWHVMTMFEYPGLKQPLIDSGKSEKSLPPVKVSWAFLLRYALDYLYERLWSNIHSKLESAGIKRVIVIPHGALANYPLAAIEDSSRPIVECYEILYSPNISRLIYTLSKTTAMSKEGGFVAVVNSTGDLEGAITEIEAILPHIGKEPVLLLKADATVENFKRACSHASIIHIAVHGVYLEDDPHYSGLLLHLPEGVTPGHLRDFENSLTHGGSPKSRKNEHGSVRVYESEAGDQLIAYLNHNGQVEMKRYEIQKKGTFIEMIFWDRRIHGELLRSSDIAAIPGLSNCLHVTLSCCQSGYIHPSDRSSEYIGIIRGFLQAGVSSVLVNPWPVPDELTVTLMKGFYSRVFKPRSRTSRFLHSGAFYDAQRQFISEVGMSGDIDLLLSNGYMFYGIS